MIPSTDAITASEKTSFTFSCVFAEHSMNALALMDIPRALPSAVETEERILASDLVPTRTIGTFGFFSRSSPIHFSLILLKESLSGMA